MERPENRRSTPRFAQSVERGAGATAVADAVAETWRAVDDALAPIIGKRGMAVLYTRSIYVTATAHPSLSSLRTDIRGAIDLPALSAVLAQQDCAAAVAVGDALLQAFADLLATLVGAPLAERLLDPVWSHLTSGAPAQHSTP